MDFEFEVFRHFSWFQSIQFDEWFNINVHTVVCMVIKKSSFLCEYIMFTCTFLGMLYAC